LPWQPRAAWLVWRAPGSKSALGGAWAASPGAEAGRGTVTLLGTAGRTRSGRGVSPASCCPREQDADVCGIRGRSTAASPRCSRAWGRSWHTPGMGCVFSQQSHGICKPFLPFLGNRKETSPAIEWIACTAFRILREDLEPVTGIGRH
jgi:hypothetical protein